MATAHGTRLQLARPALALWRAPGVLQVGLDSPAVVLERVPDGIDEAIRLLARPHSPDELGSLLPGLEAHWWPWLLERLSASGLLVPATPPPPPSLVVVGAGRLADAVATALASAGPGTSRVDPVGFAGLPAATAAREVVVLAGRTAEPDRAMTDSLFREGRTHLVVRLEPDRAVVGPFVQPGVSPCVRCQDLARVRLDPAWPALLAQLCREPVAAEPSLLAWAAATAAVQVRAWLAGGTPETHGASLELELGDFRLHGRPWRAHPGCGCLQPPG